MTLPGPVEVDEEEVLEMPGGPPLRTGPVDLLMNSVMQIERDPVRGIDAPGSGALRVRAGRPRRMPGPANLPPANHGPVEQTPGDEKKISTPTIALCAK